MNSPETNGCIQNLLACQFEVRRLIKVNAELVAALKSAVDHIQDLRSVLEDATKLGLTLHMCGVTYDDAKAHAAIAKAETL